jgi:hypothetical protein
MQLYRVFRGGDSSWLTGKDRSVRDPGLPYLILALALDAAPRAPLRPFHWRADNPQHAHGARRGGCLRGRLSRPHGATLGLGVTRLRLK